MSQPLTLIEAALDVLNTADPHQKVERTLTYSAAWKDGALPHIGTGTPPDVPARPQKPVLMAPKDMPRRRLGSEAGRLNMIHAIAHIELNAIDLAWDIIARFTSEDLPRAFYDDWVQVGEDEAMHFKMLEERLGDFDQAYGDCPAHNGLWDAAAQTSDDLMARLALVPMLLEPRGLDTTPPTVAKLRALGDDKTADIMERIGREEIPHVAAGTRWFEYMAEKRSVDPVATYHEFVKSRFKGALKPPFNVEARTKAGMNEDYYQPLAKMPGAA